MEEDIEQKKIDGLFKKKAEKEDGRRIIYFFRESEEDCS